MKKIFLSLISVFMFVTNICATQTDIIKIKERVIESILEEETDDSKCESLINSLKTNGVWPNIDYEDLSNEGFEHRIHLSNMLFLARAYNINSSKFYKSQKVKHIIESALRNWVDNDYISQNWWHNQIGTPNSLVTLMLLIGDELEPELVQKAQPIIKRGNINASGARPGGDRIKIAGIETKNMLFTQDYDKFEKMIRVIESEIKYVHWIGNDYGYPTSTLYRRLNFYGLGQGIQYDNSFHHRWDGVNNTLSYGDDYARAFVEWAEYIAGTSYVFSSEKINQLIDYYLDGICKHSVFGKYPDMGAQNREIARVGFSNPFNSSIPLSLLKITDYRKNELEEIANIRKGVAKNTLSHATFYWNTEHFTFQRPNWFTSVRMYSNRNYNMEEPYNSEAFFNHHRGDGTNHLYRKGDEYYDISPVLDFQKIPGTTVMQKPELTAPGQILKLGLTDFVGAVTDGLYGAAAFDFKSPHDPLVARKAWFFFDNEYVCLGTGISCETQSFVATTINQCLLRGDVIVSTGAEKFAIEKDEKEFKKIDWIYHDEIGYVFPKGANVNIKNTETTGSWWDISKQSRTSKKQMNLDIFKLWIDHGQQPSNESYEYIVVPATKMKDLESNISKQNIEILSNTPYIQAVKNSALNITEIVFYKAGEIQITEKLKLVSDNPGIFMVKTDAEQVVEISVADPNRELRKMHFSLSTKIKDYNDSAGIIWNERTNMTDFTIDLPGDDYSGKSVTVKL